MHPIASIVHAGKLRQQEILAAAAHETLCAQAAGRQSRVHPGSVAWALPVAVAVIAAIAAAAGGDPTAIMRAIAGGR